MSTVLNTNGESLQIPKPYNPATFVCDIVYAKWNPDVTHPLRDGAVETLREAGVKNENIRLHAVPGTVELINAAGVLVKRRPDAVIIIGCVIRGDTPHFDYVCQQAAQGAAILNAQGETPVIFGVLTVDNLQQALDRAGGTLGNKGAEAAVAAIEMANFHAQIC
ncbi:MAG: 6,7-dimethyl-8-ribityllumazine synthase [Muribaculaceae bacterium]|nr:6,7-dimethyl-8-ribityllumazine synthase [Muribaculaceae bacterium]